MDNAAYIVNLPWQRSFSPNASYTEGHPAITDTFIDGAPRFAVGTTVVWGVDPRSRTVRSY